MLEKHSVFEINAKNKANHQILKAGIKESSYVSILFDAISNFRV